MTVATIWIVNAYQLTITMSLLSFSALGDIYGYKRIFLIGTTIFCSTSLFCALSSSFAMLTPHFGYFTEPTLFGMVTAENQLVYNLDANPVQIDEGTEKGANLEKGKAFLQKLYDDLAKR